MVHQKDKILSFNLWLPIKFWQIMIRCPFYIFLILLLLYYRLIIVGKYLPHPFSSRHLTDFSRQRLVEFLFKLNHKRNYQPVTIIDAFYETGNLKCDFINIFDPILFFHCISFMTFFHEARFFHLQIKISLSLL